jgi:hypothetical protein
VLVEKGEVLNNSQITEYLIRFYYLYIVMKIIGINSMINLIVIVQT